MGDGPIGGEKFGGALAVGKRSDTVGMANKASPYGFVSL